MGKKTRNIELSTVLGIFYTQCYVLVAFTVLSEFSLSHLNITIICTPSVQMFENQKKAR